MHSGVWLGLWSIIAWWSQLKTIAVSFCNLHWSCRKLHAELCHPRYNFLSTPCTQGILARNEVKVYVKKTCELELTWFFLFLKQFIKCAYSYRVQQKIMVMDEVWRGLTCRKLAWILPVEADPPIGEHPPQSRQYASIAATVSQNLNWFSNFYASITSTGSQLNFNWVSNFELKMEDPTWFWGGVEPWKPPPRHISSKRWGRLSELHYESNAKVRSSGSQVCAANVGNDLQQNIQETNHYQHHTILYQVCQVKPLFLKEASEGYIILHNGIKCLLKSNLLETWHYWNMSENIF